jgi:hypothetical protein
MKLGTLLLGTAAGLMVASAAQAADLPGEPVPAAVDYVRVCDTFGAGFFYIPGSETCLNIGGRVRFTVRYDDAPDDIFVRTDGRVHFDARTSTEYGQLRSFIRIAAGGDSSPDYFIDDAGILTYGDNDGRDAVIDNLFIQLGYLTVGYTGDLFNGDVLYGIDSAPYTPGDQDRMQVTLLADDLGGGFYVGGSVALGVPDDISEAIDDADELHFYAVAGISNQPWGGVDLSLAYSPLFDFFAVKATADLTLVENLNARLVAAYADADGADDVITLAGALAYNAGAATVYAGVSYDILDGDDDLAANLGVDYTVVDGLIATGELSYSDPGEADDSFAVIGRLTRNW